jgi:chemotaxis protein MotB
MQTISSLRVIKFLYFLAGCVVLTSAILVFIFVDNVYLEGMFTTQNKEIHRLESDLEKSTLALTQERARIALLEKHLTKTRKVLSILQDAEEVTSADLKNALAQDSELQSETLRLKEALKKLKSHFVGYFKTHLKDFPEVSLSQDRFVFKADVLFPSGSAKIHSKGQRTLDKIAHTIHEISKEAPADLKWVLRVDGHTDAHPIHTAKYASNWELAAARALAVVNFLIKKGVPPRYLAAASFSSYQPYIPNTSEEAMAKNRRIEFHIDQP